MNAEIKYQKGKVILPAGMDNPIISKLVGEEVWVMARRPEPLEGFTPGVGRTYTESGAGYRVETGSTQRLYAKLGWKYTEDETSVIDRECVELLPEFK